MSLDGNPDAVRSPSLEWEGLVPRARHYGDIYYGRSSPDAERRYVFLEGNGLSERFGRVRRFVVGETGFGAGLNFLVCRELWRRVAPPAAQLDYLSAELHPLALRDLRRALSGFPELRALSGELCSAWPPAEPGFRRLNFDGGRCRLTLLFGEVGEMLEELETAVDAWFLDGFAPAKNPAMWREAVIRRISALSSEGTTFATFTAAGEVRRSLERVGFRAVKRRGFDGKREVLSGHFTGTIRPPQRHPWFAYPRPAPKGSIAVIGAGLAGCAVAHALARRGREVLLFERRHREADEASGNPAGVVMPLVSSIRGLPQRWYAAAFRYALSCYETFGPRVGWQQTGVLHCALEQDAMDRLARAESRDIWPTDVGRRVLAAEASAIAAVALPWPAVHFPEGGWIQPRALCAAYLSEGSVDRRFGRDVASLRSEGERWCLLDADGRALARVSTVVLSTGTLLERFSQTVGLPVKPVRGQVTLAKSSDRPPKLQAVLGGMGYTIPGVEGGYLLGATYDADDLDPSVRSADNQRNLHDLDRLCPALRRTLDEGSLAGRVGFRATSPDVLPLVGPVPDECGYRGSYPRLDLGRRPGSYPSAPYQPSLYVSGGYGSRALVSTPLAAQILVSEICGTPSPLGKRLMHAIHPARFLVRKLSRS